MKITEHIQNSKKTLFSFEILPPLKGDSINKIFSAIDPLMQFEPPFIDVTFHREEYRFENGQKRIVRKKPGTVGICSAIMHKYNVDTVPHIICGGFSKDDIENILIDLKYLGIDNVLALQGDSMKTENAFVKHPQGHSFANELVGQIKNMNNGIYLDEENADNSNFCIGVAGYPEKHSHAVNLDEDICNIKKKVDAGADYIVTQMFFDNEKYFSFVEKCRKSGITVPIIPGIKPLAIARHLEILPKFFHLNIPEELKREVLKCKDNKQVRQVGIEWAIQQSLELKENGVPVLHYYTMSKSDNVEKIAKAVF